ncbi:MAG: carboxypeptidase-like regulatory domain-containing protein [Polyangiales bacterium]
MTERLAIVLLLLAGCSFESATSLETVDNRCGGDADCAAGVCDGNICIDVSGATVEVAIEVVGSASEAQRAIPASWAFDSEPFTGSNARDLVLPATREVRGTVWWDGLRVPATLRFVRRMRSAVEPLAPVPVEVDTLREPVGGPGLDGYDFSTVLVAGEMYDVIVIPTSDMVTSPTDTSAPAIRSLPPLYLEATVEGGDPADPFRFDISFPADLATECSASRKTNCTLAADVASFDGEIELAEPGLQVRAIDEVTGRVVSSIGETDAWGRFAIRIGDETPDYLIRVTSSAGAEPFPAVSIDPDVAFAGDPDRKVVRIPRLDPVWFTGSVRDQAGAPVPDATVRFLSSSVFDYSELGLSGSFSGSATTNDDGTFGAELLSGFYSITVTPPDDSSSSWGVLSSEALVGEEVSVAEVLVVPSKVELFGWVRTFNEEAAAGVPVLARARLNSTLGSMHRSQEAVSNSQGGFTMGMDLGLYDMHIKVPSETGYAWLVEPALAMDNDLARTYRLDPPLPVEGLVRASDGNGVPGALIRAYVLADDGTSKRPVQVAETVADEEGNYRLLIAPRLGDE